MTFICAYLIPSKLENFASMPLHLWCVFVALLFCLLNSWLNPPSSGLKCFPRLYCFA